MVPGKPKLAVLHARTEQDLVALLALDEAGLLAVGRAGLETGDDAQMHRAMPIHRDGQQVGMLNEDGSIVSSDPELEQLAEQIWTDGIVSGTGAVEDDPDVIKDGVTTIRPGDHGFVHHVEFFLLGHDYYVTNLFHDLSFGIQWWDAASNDWIAIGHAATTAELIPFWKMHREQNGTGRYRVVRVERIETLVLETGEVMSK